MEGGCRCVLDKDEGENEGRRAMIAGNGKFLKEAAGKVHRVVWNRKMTAPIKYKKERSGGGGSAGEQRNKPFHGLGRLRLEPHVTGKDVTWAKRE